MKKKSKQINKKNTTRREPRGFYFYIKRYFFFTVILLFFFTCTTLLLKSTQAQTTCANSKTCTSDLTEKIQNGAIGFFQGRKVIPPTIDSSSEALNHVLGATTVTGDKHIYVDLSTQTLYAYQGTTLFMKTLVASGRWGRTPVGNFHIWEKLVSTLMAGGEGADAYYLPNVPYVMYFKNDFGLHGAYWHDNFGHTMSHGCVNMRTVDAKTLFEWADGPHDGVLGTPVSICDQITTNNQCIQNNPIQ